MQFHQADLSPMHVRSLFFVFFTTFTLSGCGGSEGPAPLDFPVSTKMSAESIHPNAAAAPVLSSNEPVLGMPAMEKPIESPVTIAAQQKQPRPEAQVSTAISTNSAVLSAEIDVEPAPADFALEIKADDLFAASPVRIRNDALAGQSVEN